MRVHPELINHYLSCDLPLGLKGLILAFSGHIRTARKSVAYFLYLPINKQIKHNAVSVD